MRLFAGDFEMAAAREVTIDFFFPHDLLDEIDGSDGAGVHRASALQSVALHKLFDAEFEPGEHHAAVAGAGAPTDALGFENHNTGTTLRESTSGGQSREAGTDDRNVRRLRE